MNIQWPDGIDKASFLRDYWQKKPLLIRQAFPDFDNPLSPDELAGLACDEDIPSRLVRNPSANHWAVEHGPFAEEDLSNLPGSSWSLLVSDIEKHLPDFINYVQPFRFIPDWRIDDLMISFAPTGGSVGPHTDQYDVFLLQADGNREWQIGDAPIEKAELIPELDLKILRHFTPAQILTLEPGDLLYLPPGIAHHGISLDEQCMTWSFGFRAPSVAAMVADFARYLASTIDEDLLYKDADLVLQKNSGEISIKAQKQLYKMLKDKFTTDETIFSQWLGRFLTESGGTGLLDENTEFSKHNDLLAELEGSDTLNRCTQSRLAYVAGDDRCKLFANGQSFTSSHEMAETLCAAYRYSAEKILDLAENAQNRLLLNELHKQNILFVDS